MTPEERRQKEKEREEADAKAMADDLFGGVDDRSMNKVSGAPGQAMMSGDKVVMKDLKDHLRHAKKVGECIQVSFVGHDQTKMLQLRALNLKMLQIKMKLVRRYEPH